MIKVMLVEDDPFWVENLTADLRGQADMELVFAAKTKEEAIAFAAKNVVDVILMDINLTDNNLDGIEATEELAGQGIRVIMLSSLGDDDVILDSFECGAINFVHKANVHDIFSCIREAHENKITIHADASSILRNGFIRVKRELTLQSLTPGEREVYDLKQQGLTKAQIAEKLHKSLFTIKNQWKSVRTKLKGRLE